MDNRINELNKRLKFYMNAYDEATKMLWAGWSTTNHLAP